MTPPDFVIDRTLVQLASLRGATGEANVLVASIERRGAAFGGGWGAKAQKIFDGKIAPALDRQIAALAAVRETADHAPRWRW